MYQSKDNPHKLQEISTNILTKMSDITGSPHWACSEKCKQKNLVTENSVSAVCASVKCPLPPSPHLTVNISPLTLYGHVLFMKVNWILERSHKFPLTIPITWPYKVVYEWTKFFYTVHRLVSFKVPFSAAIQTRLYQEWLLSEVNFSWLSRTFHLFKKLLFNVAFLCFVGFTLLAYVNIVSAAGPSFLGYISSMKLSSDRRNGAAIVGYLNNIVLVSTLFTFLNLTTENKRRHFNRMPTARFLIVHVSWWTNLNVSGGGIPVQWGPSRTSLKMGPRPGPVQEPPPPSLSPLQTANTM